MERWNNGDIDEAMMREDPGGVEDSSPGTTRGLGNSIRNTTPAGLKNKFQREDIIVG